MIVKKYISTLLIMILPIILFSQGEGYAVNLKNGGTSGFFSGLGLTAFGGLFLSAAAAISTVGAIKAFVFEKNPTQAFYRLLITLLIIGIFKVLV